MRTFLAIAALAATFLPGPSMAQARFHGESTGAAVTVMTWRDIPFRTVVRQQYDFSCGSAALATLLTYHYGMRTTETDAFKAMYATGDQEKIKRVGFSMLDMKRYLEERGLKSDGYRLSLDELATRKTPVIALIDVGRYRHFVVVKGIAGNKVLVGDPALGLKSFEAKEFSRMWNGIAFSLHEGEGGANPAFNTVSEWRPWSRAPLQTALTTEGLAALTSSLPMLYQVSPVRPIPSVSVSGGGL